MQIDWLTVVAQIVNFLILVWLLRRFLYGPVMRAIARREQRIAESLAEAGKIREAAEAEGRAYREQQADLERRSRAIMSEARAAAEQAKEQMLRQARAEAEARRREWVGQVEAQQREFIQGLRRRVAEEYLALARRMLRDMADVALETQMVSVFVRHLGALDANEREKLAAAAEETGRVRVESCFDLAEGERAELEAGLGAALGPNVQVEYVCDASQAFGIALRAGGQSLLWTFDDYLDELELRLTKALERRPPIPSPEIGGLEVTPS